MIAVKIEFCILTLLTCFKDFFDNIVIASSFCSHDLSHIFIPPLMKAKFLIFFLLFSGTLMSQKNQKTLDLKGYFGYATHSGFDYFDEEWPDSGFIREKIHELGNPVIAVKFDRNVFFQEISISDLRFRQSIHQWNRSDSEKSIRFTSAEIDDELIELNFRFLYELGFRFLPDSKIAPSFSAGIEPFVSYVGILPTYPPFFPVHNTRIGTNLYVIPRITYELSPRLYFDLSVPISLFQAYWNRELYSNPALTFEEQRTRYFNGSIINGDFQIRMGLGVRI